ncbi:Chitotriosidase-1-like protein, partial [Leptotrombidium deliense]
RNTHKYKVVCYYEGNSDINNGLRIENIDPCVCTHMIYKFAMLHNGYIIQPEKPQFELNTPNNGNNGLYRRFNSMKNANPNLSTMIAVGGGDQNFINYVNLMQNSELRYMFAHNAVRFLTTHGFDGLDIGWSYPSSAQDPRTIYHNFVLLLRELRNHFEPYGLILSASISGFQQQIDAFYNVAGISDNVDFINVAAFTQTHGPIYQATPLFTHSPHLRPYSISYIVDYLLMKQVDPRKLVVGLPAYGVLKQPFANKHFGQSSHLHQTPHAISDYTISLVNYNQVSKPIN